MRVVASAVTAFALLAHAVLGCCSHHAHTADSSREASSATECCHDHDCHERAPAKDDHQEPAPCDEADCSFASDGARLTVDSPLLGLVLPLVELASRPVRCAGQSVEGADGMERPQGIAVFLLHQRMVI
jgi:hypothetical protein